MPDTTTARNVFERKLAVMDRCKDIVPDATHFKGFTYNSIQQVSNRLREFAVAEGLDISVDFPPEFEGFVRVTLTNIDQGDSGFEYITKFYPITQNDVGLAYSTKYALVRLFLIGDGEEGDEAEMAQKSSAAPPPVQPKTTAPKPAATTAKTKPPTLSERLTEAVRALREEGKVTGRMVELLKELNIGKDRRVSDLTEKDQAGLLQRLLVTREEAVGARDDLQKQLEDLVAEALS